MFGNKLNGNFNGTYGRDEPRGTEERDQVPIAQETREGLTLRAVASCAAGVDVVRLELRKPVKDGLDRLVLQQRAVLNSVVDRAEQR